MKKHNLKSGLIFAPHLALMAIFAVIFLVLFSTPANAEAQTITSFTTHGNGGSYYPFVNGSGQFIAFHSIASNLVANDLNSSFDVFVYDRTTDVIERVSVSSGGIQGNGDSANVSISSDGRFVALRSDASNLVPDDTNGRSDIFVHDRQTGNTTRVSVASDGGEANFGGQNPTISSDGRYVVFESSSNNLVLGDTNLKQDIFVHDTQTGLTERVNISSSGLQGNDISGSSSNGISSDGRFITFSSWASNLVSDDTNNYSDIFVHDRITHETTRVSVSSDGIQGDHLSEFPTITPDGRFVAFSSWASNLVSGDIFGSLDIFVHDRVTGQTSRASIASDGSQVGYNKRSYVVSISDDGRFVVFYSDATNLAPGDFNNFVDVFIHDRFTHTTVRFSNKPDGESPNGVSYGGSISGDGRIVAFNSSSNEILPNDANGVADIFVMENPLYGLNPPSNNPPTLSFPEIGPYAGDGIDPNTGDTSTQFTFKVIYTDADNDPPTDLHVVVFNGGTASSTLFMSPDTDVSINPELRDGNYQNGEQYIAISTFPEGNYSYVFETSDINNGGQPVLFPIIATPTFTVADALPNQPPRLSFLESSPDGLSENDGIQDNKGTAEQTSFMFRTVYTDADNDLPLEIKLILEKFENNTFTPYREYNLFAENPQDFTYTDGKEYFVGILLSQGKYRYYFRAEQSGDTAVIFPLAGDVKFVEAGYSNVAFLPGLEASRLYRPDPDGLDNEDQLWEPTWEQDVKQLFFHEDEQGNIVSNDSEIYTRDIIKQKKHILWNIYQQFSVFMDDIVEADVIHEWEALPYDWRLAFDDVLESGIKTGENISYLKSTSSPYIIQELRRLAETSDTGKVTIITHSNGGLLAKYLLASIEPADNPNHDVLDKIDNVIMIAAPQVGTPKAIAGLLHGDEQDLALGLLLDKETARDFAEFMPGAYSLLPSDAYFGTVSDPVFSFTDEAGNVPELNDLAGKTINSYDGMLDFLRGHGGAWDKSDVTETDVPNVLNGALLIRSRNIHEMIDNWEPKGNLKVIQLAGWGLKTIKGIKYDDCDTWFCSDTLEHLDREPILTHVGDETVVMPSALFMENADRYYVNIRDNNAWLNKNRDHASILEIDDVRQFIKNIIIGKTAPEEGQGVENITINEPILKNSDLSLEFVLHSPVELHLKDEAGRHTGIIENPDPNSDLRLYEKQIPNSYYFEFGEKKYAGADYKPTTVVLKGENLGVFSLDIKEVLGENIISSARFSNIPVSENTTATMQIEDGANNIVLNIDCDGNGTSDISIKPSEEYSAKDALNVFVEIIRSLSINEKTKKILIQKIQSVEKQVEKNNLNAAYSILENIKHVMNVFSGKLTPAQDRIPQDEADKLLRILDTIKIK